LDLGVEAEYKVGKRLSIWVEANNLLNRRYYTYPLYPSVGINCTAGVKLVF
jgi:outer membrane receptor protein involved in Fe transport